MDRRGLPRIGGPDAHKAAALGTQQRADASYARERMQLSADGVCRIERHRALRVRRLGRWMRAHEAAGGDRRHGEIAAARERVAQAGLDPSA